MCTFKNSTRQQDSKQALLKEKGQAFKPRLPPDPLFPPVLLYEMIISLSQKGGRKTKKRNRSSVFDTLSRRSLLMLETRNVLEGKIADSGQSDIFISLHHSCLCIHESNRVLYKVIIRFYLAFSPCKSFFLVSIFV